MDRPVRILLVDDHPLFLSGLARVIRDRDDLELVGSARSGRDGVREIHRLAPDVALVDQRMPDIDGLEVCRHVAGGHTRVLLLTGDEDPELRQLAAANGADACLSKGLPWPAILDMASTTARALH